MFKDFHGDLGRGWIGVDLDGTLAEYYGWVGPDHIGEPVEKMLARVICWLTDGKEVRIVTARVAPGKKDSEECRRHIERWVKKYVFSRLPEPPAGTEYILHITHEKDHRMIELWDDRVVQVIPNTGERVDGKS